MASSEPLEAAAKAHADALAAQVAQQEAAAARDIAVRAAYDAGASAPEIAAELGVTRYRVYAILKSSHNPEESK